MRTAQIIAQSHDDVRVQLFGSDGAAGGQISVTKEVALSIFGPPTSIIGHTLDSASWPVMDRLVRAIFANQTYLAPVAASSFTVRSAH